jgi:hypothetical protein
MHNSLKIIKTLLYYYSALHASGTLAPIISSLLILHLQPPVTVCRWVGCIFQLWSVTTVAKADVLITSYSNGYRFVSSEHSLTFFGNFNASSINAGAQETSVTFTKQNPVQWQQFVLTQQLVLL